MAMSAPHAPGTPDEREPDGIAYDWSIRIESPDARNGALGRHAEKQRAENALRAAMYDLPVGTTATGTLQRGHIHGRYPAKDVALAHLADDGRLSWSLL